MNRYFRKWSVALGWGVLLWTAGLVAAPAPSLRGNLGIHDPSTIIKCKERYYIFGTAYGISSKSSADKVFWSSGPNVFAAPPAWTTNAVPGFDGTFWAPDIMYYNGQYRLYYAVSTWGSQLSAIGLVTNPTLDPTDPAYQWTDQGPVIQSTQGSPYNTIDPSVTLDALGNPWMTFGSYWSGIYLVQLEPNSGMRIAADSPTYRLAYNSSIEASCLFRRGGYYYLFANWGSCCSGVNSTYNIRVGRSSSITGPYLDRNGVDMAANGGTLFLQGSGKFSGPGHMGILAENGTRWFSYHYYDAGDWNGGYNAYGSPKFDLEPLGWTADDWPVFTNDWSAVYRFESDARDENGQYYGLLLNGASIQSDPVHGRVLNLNGTNQYARLPAGTAFARTFSAVVKWNGGGNWQRLFDFGVDTTRYVMLTPRGGTGTLRCDIRANGTTQVLEAPGPLPIGAWAQVALTLDGTRGILYLNGAPVATNSSMSLSPLDTLAETNYLGHSKFVADPDFNGQIACFRAYGRVLSAAEIAAPQPVISQPADNSLYWPGTTVAFGGSATDLMDLPLAAGALTWRVELVQDDQTNVVFGPVSGLANGSFTIPASATGGGSYRVVLVATDGVGRQGTVVSTLLPAAPPLSWSSWYPLHGNATDANGHFNATLQNGASFVSDPVRGTVLNLSGNNQFVSLPPGAGHVQTFMAWVRWNGGNAWQRIFDFGNDTTRYAVLTPSAANGKLRFNITVNGIGGEQVLDGPGPLPVGVWTHVAVTLDGATGILYTNGIAVATNANVNLLPADLRATNCYFGKSQWPDPYFNGQLSAVRLFSRALGPAEITAPQPSIAQPGQGALYQPGSVISFAGSAADFYDAAISSTGLTWTVQYRSSTATNTVLSPLSGVAAGSFSVPSSGVTTTNGSYRFILTATDALGRSATTFVDIFPASTAGATADWASYYPFTSSALDASNRYNGTLQGGASIQSDGARGNVLNLSGSGQYVSLPSGASGFCTFAGWVKWNGGNAWQRIFDFGQGTGDWVMLTPKDGDGKMQVAISTERNSFVQVIQAPAPLPTNSWVHLAVVFDGRQGILYSNGQAVAVNNSVNLLPGDVKGSRNYFGRSQYSADAYFNGRLDAVKLDSRALAPTALFAPSAVILQPAAGATYAGGELISYAGAATDYSEAALPASAFAWSAEFLHDGQADSVFGPITGSTSGSFQVPTNGPASTNVFYRLNLQVTDASGNQRLVSTAVAPKISQISLATIPAGLQVALDGQVLGAPVVVPAVAGLTRTLEVRSPQSFGGRTYQFVLWSDGGAATHTFQVPLADAVYTASFVPPTLALTGDSVNLTLSWPAWAGCLQLYRATNLLPPAAWAPVTNSPATLNEQRVLVLPNSDAKGYYRLQSPQSF